MPPRQLDDLIEPGADVLGTTVDANGTILAQTGDVVGRDVSSDNAEWWQHVGFASRPAKAIGGKSAAQTIAITQGSNDICVASRDIRGQQLAADLGFGETIVYARGPDNAGRGRVTLSDDGSASILRITTQQGNAEGGTVVEVRVGSDGKIQVNGAQVELGQSPTDFVALASLVMSNLNALAATLLTGSNSGGPVVFGTPYTPSQVAATQVKAK